MTRELAPLGWLGIARLGLVQSAIGAVVMLATSLLNRIMVVEYAQAAALPAGLVAFHYAVQLTRPKWGHGSDLGKRRTPWIIGGMAVLAAGGLLATQATLMLADGLTAALPLAICAYAMIGGGVGAAGTSLLALLATRTAEKRRPAAAALTWIMMILGIVVTATSAGKMLEPYSPERLFTVAAGVALGAFLLALMAVAGIEGPEREEALEDAPVVSANFGEAVRGIWGDPLTKLFTIFVFVSMLAYAMQDLILEPFAGLVFGMTPGQSTQLSGIQHGGVLLGMILVGIGGHGFTGGRSAEGNPRFAGLKLKRWIVGGCLGSAAALAALAMAANVKGDWPLAPTVFVLGFANGVFAVAAIGSMMDLAGRGGPGLEGIRMGLWGASQAIAFGLGGFFGASAVDLGRNLLGEDGPAFELVFAFEAAIFIVAAMLAVRLNSGSEAAPAKELMA